MPSLLPESKLRETPCSRPMRSAQRNVQPKAAHDSRKVYSRRPSMAAMTPDPSCYEDDFYATECEEGEILSASDLNTLHHLQDVLLFARIIRQDFLPKYEVSRTNQVMPAE